MGLLEEIRKNKQIISDEDLYRQTDKTEPYVECEGKVVIVLLEMKISN